MENQWIDKILEKSSPVVPEYPEEAELAKLLVDTCYAHKDLCPNGLGKVLASAFDLLVAGQYYGALSHAGWLYCPSEEQRLFFHYTNCCPRDVLGGSFHSTNPINQGLEELELRLPAFYSFFTRLFLNARALTKRY